MYFHVGFDYGMNLNFLRKSTDISCPISSQICVWDREREDYLYIAQSFQCELFRMNLNSTRISTDFKPHNMLNAIDIIL